MVEVRRIELLRMSYLPAILLLHWLCLGQSTLDPTTMPLTHAGIASMSVEGGRVGRRSDRARGRVTGHGLGPGRHRPGYGLSASRLPAQTERPPPSRRRMGAASCVVSSCRDCAVIVLLAVVEPVECRGAVPWGRLWRLVVRACRIGLRRMLPPQAPEDAPVARVVVRGVAAGGARRR